MDYISHGVEETEDMGRRLGAVLRPGAVVDTGGTWGPARLPLPGDWPGDWAVPPG